MVNFILELISFNEGVDYSIVTKIVVVYLVLLWVFVSVWVFNDAKYRFNNLLVAGILGFLNLLLSFPFLLIYLLIRPSHRDEWDDTSDGGINIPVANFTGKDGVVISLQLKIDTKKILEEKIDYNLDVVLNKENEEPTTGKIEISAHEEETLSIDTPNDSLKTRRLVLPKIKERFTNMVSNLKSKLEKDDDGFENDPNEKVNSSEEYSSADEVKSASKKKKKSKKGKKKKNK